MSSPTDKTICQNCRLEYDGDALFCPNCGTAKSRGDGDPLLGSTVGERYLLLERLGQGGSGTIYRGEHVTLRRRVAVKVLHHELSRDDLAIERFRREATTVGEIDNDHIVQIHDFGRTSDGRLYLAMEFLEGHTLANLLEGEGALSVEQTVHILVQLGEALMEAHAMGYVHRDLRPGNIYLSVRRGSANYVKLLDFGLAKLVEKEGEAASTSLGMTFGDPRYMSPEQARGDPIDRRADIYSLGCIAYEMLCGHPPFTGDKAFEILSRHVEEPPPEPAARRPEIPAWLNGAVLRCLAKGPDERFITVYRLVEALRQGTDSGVIMSDAVARRRESDPPPSVSRAMEKLAARRAEEEAAEASPERPSGGEAPEGPIRGGRTALGIGVGGAGGARVDRVIDDGPTEPSPPPDTRGAQAGGAAVEEGGGDDPEEGRITAVSTPKRRQRPTGKPRKSASSSAGISAAWYADGEAMEADEELDQETRAKLDRARGRTPSRTGMLSVADDEFYEPGKGRLKLVGEVVGALLGVVLLAVWAWPSGEETGAAQASEEETEPASASASEGGAETAALPAGEEIDAAVTASAGADAAPKELANSTPTSGSGGGSSRPDRDPAPDRTGGSGGSSRPDPDPDPDRTGGGGGSSRPDSKEDPEPDPGPDPGGEEGAEDKAKARFYANLGSSKLRDGDILGAATNFNKALKHDRRNSRARAGLGEIALTQGSYGAAIEHLRGAARLSPRSARVHTLLGEAYLGAGRRGQAAGAFKKALKIDPDSDRAREGFREASGT